MFKVLDYGVSGLDFSMRASGLPKTLDIEKTLEIANQEEYDSMIERALKLGKCKQGSGHDCYLKGITINAIIQSTLPFFGQLERYSFQDTISSTSQMHKLGELSLDDAFDEDVDEEILERLVVLQDNYKESGSEEDFRKLVMSTPQGFIYCRAIATNYLQLKTIYNQRRHHKLAEWRECCEKMEKLPAFLELIGYEERYKEITDTKEN